MALLDTHSQEKLIFIILSRDSHQAFSILTSSLQEGEAVYSCGSQCSSSSCSCKSAACCVSFHHKTRLRALRLASCRGRCDIQWCPAWHAARHGGPVAGPLVSLKTLRGPGHCGGRVCRVWRAPCWLRREHGDNLSCGEHLLWRF